MKKNMGTSKNVTPAKAGVQTSSRPRIVVRGRLQSGTRNEILDSGFRRNDADVQPPALAPRLALELRTAVQNPKEEKKRRDKMKNGLKARLVSVLLVAGSVLLWGLVLKAQEPAVVKIPHLINFQSALTDPAGNPLSDGKYNVLFRFLDVSGNSLYEEWQNLESQDGTVSAMVGSQNDLSLALLSPASVKFLSVQVEGQGPEIRMEIASVPYAYYAEEALAVAPLSIGTESIKPKSITAELLADDVLAGLMPSTVVQVSQLDDLKGDYSGTMGASKIGINGSFVYSQGNQVQNVLKDLDTAIYQRQVNLDVGASNLQNQINTKAPTTYVDDNINAAKDFFQSALDTSVSLAESANQALEESLQDQIDTMPKIKAHGIVSSADLSITPESARSNISGVERISWGSRTAYRISFREPVPFPYVVVANAFNSGADDGDRDDIVAIETAEQTNTSFIVSTVNGASGG
ncbi:MAG: hypothetical protein Q8P84_09120, partial [Deltaproteobacteria bacterium]|nr:hypothetical protein [Deltaproteobacteria bacterium]